MSLTVEELHEKLEQIIEDNPDAEVYIDPPYNPAYAAYFDSEENVLELTH